MQSLRDRYGPWAVVVGASDGIGASFATLLSQHRLNLVLVARRAEPLRQLSARLPTRCRVLAADAGTPEGVDAIAAASEDVGLLVCNAALAPISPFLELPARDVPSTASTASPRPSHDAILQLNCRAAVQLTHSYGQRFVDRGRGGVILLSSLAAVQGSALVAHYAATKAYLRALAEGLWYEWRPHGVDVLACCPGTVRTPTYERGRPTTPWLVGPPLEPDAVARSALRALGRGPVSIPGWRNRLTSLVSRATPRRLLVALASRQTAAIFRHRS
jgi:short-subunit dehydrogenase